MSTANKRDLFQEITNRIIEEIENGVLPWVKPWRANACHGGLPYNAISRASYRGVNTLLLDQGNYTTNAWMTFNQAKAIGGKVRKGEKSQRVYFYKPFVIGERDAEGEATGSTRTIPFLREFCVFNIDQIDGLPERITNPTKEAEITKPNNYPLAAELMSMATVIEGGDRAVYYAGPDHITMPTLAAFAKVTPNDAEAGYYATALHELTHWTGHKSRNNRVFGKRFGDDTYAFEELVAEMGAAFLCTHCGIQSRTEHAQYIATWLKALKSDKRFLLSAASAAQKAFDYITKMDELALDGNQAEAA